MANTAVLELNVTIDENTLKNMAELVKAGEITNKIYNESTGALEKIIIPTVINTEISAEELDKFKTMTDQLFSAERIPIIPKTRPVQLEV